MGEALESYKYYTSGYLPEVYDSKTGRQLSILDQSEFFIKASSVVERVKNKAESQAIKESQAKTSAPTPKKGRR